MKTAILFTIPLLAMLNSVEAQFIFMPQKPIKTFNLEIDKYENSQLKTSIPFSYIRIIDSRYDTTHIGIYFSGYLALKEPSQPQALQHVIDKYYHNLYTAGKDTLIIQLEKLFIADKMGDDTNFSLTLGNISCRLFTGSNNNYVYCQSFDTLLEENYSYNAIVSGHKNGKHYNYEFWDYYLLGLYDAAIRNAATINNITNSDQQSYTLQQIQQQGLLKRQKPIVSDLVLKPGFYNNFSEFENNAPGFTYDSANALPKLLELMHYRVSKKISKEMPDTSYWGYCDGTHIFIRNRFCFFQVERKDAAFYITPTLDAKRRESNTEGWNLLIGLATLSAGIALKEGVDFNGFDLINPPLIPAIILRINNAYTYGLQLDLDTGNIIY